LINFTVRARRLHDAKCHRAGSDIAGFAVANRLDGKADVEVREAMGDKSPKRIYHSIICIGALIAHREDEGWIVDALGVPHVEERSEKALISSSCRRSSSHSTARRLDLPVLRYRAMVHTSRRRDWRRGLL
jgi:hypothetical protein